MNSAWNLSGFGAIFYKELRQILRSPLTLALAIGIPLIQMLLLGYAIQTTVEHVPAAVYRGDRGTAALAFIDAVVASHTFDVVEYVNSRKALRQAIVSGKARVGFDIPENFTADLIAGHHPSIGALIDGSDSAIAQVAYGSAVALAGVPLRAVALAPKFALEVRPYVMFNPAMRSANFFVPGLIGLIMQNITVMLTSLAIVGERERGTLEQLLVTPIGSAGLMLGKLFPYGVIAAIQFSIVVLAMRFIFAVPVAGNVLLLFGLSAIFIMTALGLGLLISTFAQTQVQAQLMTIFLLLPSVLLSGAVFERSLMPWLMQLVGYFIPLTYYIDILRGIILRGAGVSDLWRSILLMTGYGAAVFALASIRFARTTR
jgi:ABC-2 type transport system permease protein